MTLGSSTTRAVHLSLQIKIRLCLPIVRYSVLFCLWTHRCLSVQQMKAGKWKNGHWRLPSAFTTIASLTTVKALLCLWSRSLWKENRIIKVKSDWLLDCQVRNTENRNWMPHGGGGQGTWRLHTLPPPIYYIADTRAMWIQQILVIYMYAYA